MNQTQDNMQRKGYTDGLRELADWYDAHPEIDIPGNHELNVSHLNSKDEARALIRALGACKKDYGSSLVTISRNFGSIAVKFLFYRESVCRKVVVGTRDVPEKVIPAAPEQVIPAHVEEITEWKCEPILAPEPEAEAA